MINPELFIVTGISGSGITTVARHLLQRGEIAYDSKINPNLYHFVDINGQTATSLHIEDNTWRKKYKWSLNEKELSQLLKRDLSVSRVFLCGRANLFQYWHKASKVFLLKVDAPVLLERLNSESRDNLFAKDSSTQKRLMHDLDLIQDKIIQKGAIIIDAKLPINTVVNQILRKTR